jgi:hypothetical protein
MRVKNVAAKRRRSVCKVNFYPLRSSHSKRKVTLTAMIGPLEVKKGMTNRNGEYQLRKLTIHPKRNLIFLLIRCFSLTIKRLNIPRGSQKIENKCQRLLMTTSQSRNRCMEIQRKIETKDYWPNALPFRENALEYLATIRRIKSKPSAILST